MTPTLIALAAASDVLLADFEGSTYGDWRVEGSAFGPGPARGTLPNQMTVSGFQGRGLVNSYYGGDASQGSLTSPEFTITRRWMTFLIGGGYDPQNLAMQLWVEGKLERWSTGPNRKPGGSEGLQPASWDLSGLQGKKGVLRIIDQATGGWGHISVDHIVMTDRKPPVSLENPSRIITLGEQFLLIPIKNGSPAKRVTIQVEGEPPVTNDVELADGVPDWHAALDVSPLKGRRVKITVDRLGEDSKALESIAVSPVAETSGRLYEEPLRGQFHFSPRRGWTNDPNGLVLFKGEYHLFFQHNPYGWGWGNMHWGHAVSKDLVHWMELPIALFPDPSGTMFSGSAVVDWKNTSGLAQGGEPPMILLYTAAGSPFTQGLAYSQDGRRFNKWQRNPIVGQIDNADRDPKVFWHEPTKRWVMVLYLEIPGRPTLQILTSPNLKSWTLTSRLEGYHECPDLFELPVKGQDGVSKWVITGANSDYQVGGFDGRVFTPETPILKGHQGRGFYAAQTFSDVPGRRIQIGWFQTETKGMPFNQSMSLPLELSLVQTESGPRLVWTPVKEIQVLRSASKRMGSFDLEPGFPNPLAGESVELLEIEAEFTPSPDSLAVLTARGVPISYDAGQEILTVGDLSAPAPLVNGRQSLRVFCDRNGLEVFASGGRTFVPWPYPPQASHRQASFELRRGRIIVHGLNLHHLRSAWK